MQNDKEKTFIDNIKLSHILTLGVLFLIFPPLLYFLKFNDQTFSLASDTSLWGQFGDYYAGFTGPVLNFLSLIAILITVHLQKRDLLETREEAKEEAKETRRIAEEQIKTFKLQQFENTFFNMLSLLKELFENFESTKLFIGGGSHKEKGKKVLIEDIYHHIDYNFEHKKEREYSPIEIMYLNNITEICNLIDENNNLTETEKLRYCAILKTQLTLGEKALIYLIFYTSKTENKLFINLINDLDDSYDFVKKIDQYAEQSRQ